MSLILCLFCFILFFNEKVTVRCSNDCIEAPHPITYNMYYHNFQNFGVSWSINREYREYKDYVTSYPVVKYTDYAENIDDFIEKYPYVTIETSGYAYSDETFGNVGEGQFGTKRYLTNDFKHDDYFERNLVNAHGNTFWWTGAIAIGFGFKTEGTKLYLRPFIDGWMYCTGPVWRYIHYGLDAPSITFHPLKKNTTNICIDNESTITTETITNVCKPNIPKLIILVLCLVLGFFFKYYFNVTHL